MVVRRSSTRSAAIAKSVSDTSVQPGTNPGSSEQGSSSGMIQASDQSSAPGLSGTVTNEKGDNRDNNSINGNLPSGTNVISISLDELASTSSTSLDNIVIDDHFLSQLPPDVFANLEEALNPSSTSNLENATVPTDPSVGTSTTIIGSNTSSSVTDTNTTRRSGDVEDQQKMTKGKKDEAEDDERKGRKKRRGMERKESLHREQHLSNHHHHHRKKVAHLSRRTPTTSQGSTPASSVSNVSTRSRRERKVPIRFIEQSEQEMDKPKRGRGGAKVDLK